MPEQHLHTLGLAKDADLDAVTKRFRQLAMRLHPDRNKNALDEKFLKLCHAYRQLRLHYQSSAGSSPQAPSKTASSTPLWDGANRRKGRRGCRTQRRFHTVCHSDFKGVFISVKA